MEYLINVPLLIATMSFVKFDSWTPRMELKSFTTKPPHFLFKWSSVYFIWIALHLNITHNFKFDETYLINNLSKWKIEKLIHKFPSIMYTIYIYIWIIAKEKRWILLLNNIWMTILWENKIKHIICKCKILCG